MDNPEKLATQGTQDEEKQNKDTTQYVLDHYAQTNTNNVNKILTLLQTTGCKDEPDIFLCKLKGKCRILWCQFLQIDEQINFDNIW